MSSAIGTGGVSEELAISWDFYRTQQMTDEHKRAALMLKPRSAPLGLTEWETTEGDVYAKGANAIDAQVFINRRASAQNKEK